jgi:serine phosphatase RsbU (regulator of sigma subunit)
VKTKVNNIGAIRNPVDFGENENFLIVKTIGAVLFSLLLSVSASVSGFTAVPLCTAFAAVLPPFFSAAALAGTVAGVIFTGEVYIRLADIISVVAVAAVKAAAGKALSIEFGAYGSGILAWVAYTVSGLCIAIATSFTIPLAAAVIFRGILCGAAAYAAGVAAVRLKKDRSLSFSFENVLYYSAVLVLIIAAASGISAGFLNIGRIIGIFVMLSAAYVYGAGGGAAAAALSLFAFMLSSNEVGKAAVLLALAAAAAGFAGEIFFKNKFVVAAGFAVTALCAVIVCGVPSGTLPLAADLFAGTLIFTVIPEKVFSKLFGTVRSSADPAAEFSQVRSRFFCEMLKETSQNFGKVSRLLNNQAQKSQNNDNGVSSSVFYEMTVFERLFEGFSRDFIITDTAFSKKIAASAGGAFVRAGKTHCGAVVCECMYLSPPSEDKLDKIAKTLEKLTLKEFEPPEIIGAGKMRQAIFCEKAPLTLDIGAFEIPLGGMMNGDTNVTFTDGIGNDYVLISDGMGSGIRAAIESRMTVSLLKKFIQSGVGFSEAAGFVNFLLQAKSDEEMLSTVDLLVFSRFTGECILYKMGAATTFANLSGTAREFSGKSLPAGILRDPGVDKIKFRVKNGDTVLMITDGITEENFPRCREILRTKAINPKTAARRIAEESETDGRQDDKTAIFIKASAV